MVEKVAKSMKRYNQMEEGSLLTSPRENLSESFQSGKRRNWKSRKKWTNQKTKKTVAKDPPEQQTRESQKNYIQVSFNQLGIDLRCILRFWLLSPKYTLKIYNMVVFPNFVLWHDKTTTGIHPARSNFITI